MDELSAIGDPELRATLAHARSQSRPVTADEVAAALDVHRNVARSRLERLAEAGLLVPGYERRSGRSGPGAGRPAKTYTVPPELVAIEFPARRYESLLGHLLDALPARGRRAQLREVGIAFGTELAEAAKLRPSRSLRSGFERVCAAVGRLGYQASVEEVSERGAVIATPTCPLRPLVRARPEAAEIDRGMWAGLAAAALSGVEVATVECETRDCLADHASCRVLITLAVGDDRSRLRRG
jgi:predicted ArsR family transcriptional regulator